MSFSLQGLALSICLLTLVLWARRHNQRSKSKGFPLPPGPPRLPVIGNLLDIPSERAWYKFADWKKDYGDIVYVEALGNSILILNNMEVVTDLLEKRAVIYSDRPSFVMVGELMGLDQSFAMLPYVSSKEGRKLCQIALSSEAVKKYHTLQEDAVAMYISNLISHPQDLFPQSRLMAGRIVMSVTYGLPVDTTESIYMREAEETMEMLGKATVPGAFLVDLLPPLKYLPSWLPFNTIQQTAEHGRKLLYSMVNRPLEHAESEHAAGMAQPSFTVDCLETLMGTGKPQVEVDRLIRWTAGAMYGAGGETTYASILTFILAMAKYPSVQTKLQAELDTVVGGDRLPSIKDRPNLPYVNATIKEILRWKPALPLGFARKTRRADFYRGYYIPEGTIVLPNVWSISSDDTSGIPTETFSPERFLSSCVDTPTDPYSYAFGFGRRICPGKYLGDNNLFLLVTGLMATVDIFPTPVPEKEMDLQGNDIDGDTPFTAGLISYPEEYQVRIVPRSSDAVALIKARVQRVADSAGA